MKRPSLILLGAIAVAIMLPLIASAQVVAVNLTNVPDGQYVLTVKNGTVSLVPLVLIEPGVTPDVPVPPTPDSTRSKDVAQAIQKLPANDARYQNAIKFSGALDLLAGQVRGGAIPHTAIGQIYGPLMAAAVSDSAWAPVKQLVLDGLAGCVSADACATALDEYAEGSMASVPVKGEPDEIYGSDDDQIKQAAADYGFDWTSFMAFLTELLKILLPLIIR